MTERAKIIYTLTDEAPALATRSFLPIVKSFAGQAGVAVELKDISLSGRILAAFPEKLSSQQKVEDALSQLGELAKMPAANIIKLPNISASVPQLKAAISELQKKGYAVPDYPEAPQSPEENAVRARYGKVLGSAVNPVLREGNSDRRVAKSVKDYAKANPHSMGAWSSHSGTHVASMSKGDFFANEQSHTLESAAKATIILRDKKGTEWKLKESLSLQAGEVVDASVMSRKDLREYFEREYEDAKSKGLLLSLHMKATMMKVSDPIIFGQAIEVYYKNAFEKHAQTFTRIGVNPNNGLADLYAKIEVLPESEKSQIKADLKECEKLRPPLAMVDSDKGITNFHVPSDVIIDASMPAAIRSSGQMWNTAGKLQDTKALIPDRCYAGVYQATIDDCKKFGAFNPASMGSVANVGLMAQKAEEYGSHDKTFEILHDGTVVVSLDSGQTIFQHDVSKGDIWRMCQTQDAAIEDWVKLAITRARVSETPAVFWLDAKRPHDACLIKKVEKYLPRHDTTGLEILIKAPVEATQYTLQRVRKGQDTISVTGNVLRDYLTDLFPILELGTSAKMLSIVPLLAGGGLFETGAGGSAPKHVQQFVSEGHLRWDSLGEFLALAVSLEDIAIKSGDQKVKVIADTLDQATGKVLTENRSPLRKAGELDNRGSHFYLALYWAEALTKQKTDLALSKVFEPIFKELSQNESQILGEFAAASGHEFDLGGYYHPTEEKVVAAMRPSRTFNAILAKL